MRNITLDGFLDSPNIYKEKPSTNTLIGLYYACWDKDIDRTCGLAKKIEYTEEEITDIIETPIKDLEERYEYIFNIGNVRGNEKFDPLIVYLSGLIKLARRNSISINEITSFLEEQIFHLTNLKKNNPLHKRFIAKAYNAIGDAYYEARGLCSNPKHQKMFEKAAELKISAEEQEK